MKRFNKLLLSAVIALSAAMTMSSCSTDGVKDGFGGFVDSISGVIGEDAGNSLKEGFNGIADTIGGWFGAETGETEDDGGKETPAEKKVIVTFDVADGVAIEQQQYTVGKAYTLPTPTKKGHTFLGWFNGTTEVKSGDSWTIETNVTLTAKWNVNTYTLTFDVGAGSSIAAVEYEYGETYNISDKTTTRKGYICNGWKYNDESFAETGTWIYESDITIVAEWIEDEPEICQVTFNPDGGSVTPENKQMTVGEGWQLPEPTRIGYNFAGWVDPQNVTVAIAGDSWEYEGTLALKATWTKKQYTVIFEAEGDVDVPDTIEGVTYDEPFKQLVPAKDSEKVIPTRLGYRFAGWQVKGTNQVITSIEGNWIYEDDTPSDNTIVLVATWIEKVYTIKFETGNGDATADMTYKISQGEVTLPLGNDTSGEYSFVCWEIDGVECESITAELLAKADSNDVITLKAKWSGNWTKNY